MATAQVQTTFQTTTGLIGDLWTRVADAGRALSPWKGAAQPSLADLCEALLSGRGEATGLAMAREILDRYARLSKAEKRDVFLAGLTRFGVDEAALEAALERRRAEGPSASRALHHACEPRTQELIRRLNLAPGGTAALVRMRADLLECMAEHPELASLDGDFRHLFASWFNRGFLELRAIDWNTPAAILEKIIAYEAVHEIQGWDDLRRRVAAPDRRLYAFFHPALRDDPLIFVQVALTEAMPDAIAPILAESRAPLDPARARMAVFYSISNCQAGLRGISFGSFLIKQVAEDLAREFPGLRGFATLSPIPGLRDWARAEAARGDAGMLEPAEIEAVARLDALAPDLDAAAWRAATGDVAALAARYLVEARGPRGGAADPVARFHLGNGARLDRVNPAADLSPRGRAASWGAMVNYLYDLDAIEKNHEAYANGGEVICAPAVRKLSRARPAARAAAKA
ncbi:malonyl-CoA decarboxylase [Rubrimonas sp.]|uniref:malonyl-CoA decarboxylase n=1 Tax=Rubrimonas sp. TaxID=2036015 RepID=UPI002FDECA49